MAPPPRCILCGDGVPESEARACGLCAAPHHHDCWEYTGMCSAYGCGGLVEVAWSHGLVPREVHIDGRGGVALALRATAQSWLRSFWARARDLPATGRAGAAGAAVAFGGLLAVKVMFLGLAPLFYGPFWRRFLVPYLGVLTATGLTYGLLAPFLAPLSHRFPARMALATGTLALGIYLMAVRTSWAVLFGAALFGTVAAASCGEWLLGPHRPLGRSLGRVASPLRYLFTGGVFFVAGFAAALARGFPVTAGLFSECLAWSLLAGVAGGHALEVGKEEYRKHLVALVEAPAEAAGGACPESPSSRTQV